MKTNTLLSYILYLVLAGLIGTLIYKSCQLKRNQAELAKQDDEFQKTLRDYGYMGTDSTDSQYINDESTRTASDTPARKGNPPATVSKNGIEDEDPTPATLPRQTTTNPLPTKTTPVQTTPALPKEQKPIRDLDTDSAADGRYRVVAGSFTVLSGARREMERLIKMGYHDAEVGRYNHGKFAVVVVKRTNNLNEANRIVDQLERKGIDAAVIDRLRKK